MAVIFGDILYEWKKAKGQLRNPRSLTYVIPKGTRFLAICSLIKTLKETYGYTRDQMDFKMREQILSSCVYGGSGNSAPDWLRKIVNSDIEKVVSKYFPIEIKFAAVDVIDGI